MRKTQASSSDAILRNLEGLLPDLEALYKDVHSHPELSMQEKRTAGLAADRLRAAGYEVVGATDGEAAIDSRLGPILIALGFQQGPRRLTLSA